MPTYERCRYCFACRRNRCVTSWQPPLACIHLAKSKASPSAKIFGALSSTGISPRFSSCRMVQMGNWCCGGGSMATGMSGPNASSRLSHPPKWSKCRCEIIMSEMQHCSCLRAVLRFWRKIVYALNEGDPSLCIIFASPVSSSMRCFPVPIK